MAQRKCSTANHLLMGDYPCSKVTRTEQCVEFIVSGGMKIV